MIDPWLTRRSLSAEYLKVSLIRPLGTNWTADSLLKSTTYSENDKTRGFSCATTAAGAWTTQVFAHRNTILESNKGKEKKKANSKKGEKAQGSNGWPKGPIPQRKNLTGLKEHLYVWTNTQTNTTTSETRKSWHTITKGEKGPKNPKDHAPKRLNPAPKWDGWHTRENSHRPGNPGLKLEGTTPKKLLARRRVNSVQTLTGVHVAQLFRASKTKSCTFLNFISRT